MPLRFFAVFALTVFTLGLFASAAPASAQPAQVEPLGGAVANFGPPQPLYDLQDLSTFSWTLHRELTGPAGQRVYGVYKDTFKTEAGFVPATLSANGRFVLDWDGANENPDNFVQTLSIGKNQWTEWMVGNAGKAQYNAEPLIKLNSTRNELMFWWTGIAEWLDTNKSSLDCGTSPRRINEEQAVRCLIPSLTQDAKIALADKLGIFTEESTTSVTNMVFELWVTKNDTIPVQLSVEMSVVDARNTTSTGVFQIDIFDIESDDIQIQLPR
jgi:hypothetical protein